LYISEWLALDYGAGLTDQITMDNS